MSNELIRKKNHIQNECLRLQPAFCTAACPFALDVSDFIRKIGRGNFTAAYRQYRNAVAFPDIVSRLCSAPCEEACPGAEQGVSISLLALERASVEHTNRKEPNKYNVAKKEQHIAIIGAGACGLACALRFTANNYKVTVYEKSARIGGLLWELLPPEIFLPEFERSFLNADYELQMNTEIHSLDEIEADAIFIATGAGGESFGHMPGKGLSVTEADRVFLGGMLCGSDITGAIADGLNAFTLMEQYLKTGVMPRVPVRAGTKLRIDPRHTVPPPKVFPVNGVYTKDEAIKESARCLQCTCDSCLLRCDLMEYSKKMPPRIAEDVYCTVNPMSLFGGDTFAKRLMGTCNECGACRDFCPKDLDTGEFILEGRKGLQREKKWAWAYHEFWLKDMWHAIGDRSKLVRFAPEKKKCKTAFFPGCQLGASLPEYVLESYDFLLSNDVETGLWLSCCGAPALWSGIEEETAEAEALLKRDWDLLGRPEIVVACPTCMKIFAQFLPEAKVTSLIVHIANTDFIPKRTLEQKSYAIFDPCAARFDEELFQAVRMLAVKSGIHTEELPQNKNESRCCSYGGHVAIADPGYTAYQISHRIEQSDLPYIAYCANCRDIFAKAGKPCVHILDILFDLGDAYRPAPLWSDRERNREILRHKALHRFWKEDAFLPEQRGAYLLIPEEIKEQMSNDMITEDEVWDVIEFCREKERTITLPDTGEQCGFHMIGNATIWVCFIKDDEGTHVTKVYGHRMKIVLEETWNGQRVDTDL